MKRQILLAAFVTIIALGLIQCGQGSHVPLAEEGAPLAEDGADLDEGIDTPLIDEVVALPAEIKKVTPADDSESVAVTDLTVSIEFTAVASDVQITVLQKASSDVFFNLYGNVNYNASTHTAVFSPEDGWQKGRYYIVRLTWKALPNAQEVQQYTYNFTTEASTEVVDSPLGDLVAPAPAAPNLQDETGHNFGNEALGSRTKIPAASDFINKEKWDLQRYIRGVFEGREEEVPQNIPSDICNDPRAYCLPEWHDAINSDRTPDLNDVKVIRMMAGNISPDPVMDDSIRPESDDANVRIKPYQFDKLPK